MSGYKYFLVPSPREKTRYYDNLYNLTCLPLCNRLVEMLSYEEYARII